MNKIAQHLFLLLATGESLYFIPSNWFQRLALKTLNAQHLF
jgi:hypothetical protein